MEQIVDEKMSRTLLPLGAKAGGLTAQAAAWTGLRPGTAVAVANVDAHVTLPATGSIEPGTMVMIMGTSTCHVMVGELLQELPDVPGMCGVVEGGIVPGMLGYEAGPRPSVSPRVRARLETLELAPPGYETTAFLLAMKELL